MATLRKEQKREERGGEASNEGKRKEARGDRKGERASQNGTGILSELRTPSLENARSRSVNEKICFPFEAAGPRASGLIKSAKVEYPSEHFLWCRKLS